MDDRTALTEELVARLVEQCRQPLVTGDERLLADAIERHQRERGEPVARVGNSVVVGAPAGDRPLVLLVGHLDVVPPTDEDREPRVEEREGERVVVGRGTSDMKGGNVVATRIFEDPVIRQRGAYDLALVLYAAEEGAADDNELGAVLDEVTWLGGAGLAVVLEPTDMEIQAGCLGGLHALLTFHGRAAHSARPWFGENALTAAGAFLDRLHGLRPRPVELDGITYHDVWTATQAHTDNARNVVPDRFVVNLNYRFAPDRTLDEAEQELRDLVGDQAAIEVVDRAPPAPPRLGSDLVQAFVDRVGGTVAAKQAWTDVARFAAVGVPAVNFGPGLAAQAHQRGEYVPARNLTDAYLRLRRFLLPTEA